jgi:UDP-glucose 4-epimerase
MTNLIVGGTGFIGGYLAEYLLEQGEISKAIFRKGSYLRILDQCGVQNYEGDLLDTSTLHGPLEGVDVVYNLVSPTPRNSDEDFVRVNTEGVRNLLREAKEHEVKVYVHLSTLDVYGFATTSIDENTTPKPTHPYQRAKLEADKIVLEFGENNPEIRVKIVRAARAVGPGDATLTLPILRMAVRKKVVIPSSNGKISFTHPKDIAQALYKVASVNVNKDIFLVKSFDAGITEFADNISKSCGMNAMIRKQGILSGKTFLPSYTIDQIRGRLLLKEQSSWEEIGFAPSYDLKRIGSEVAEWYKKEPWITEER